MSENLLYIINILKTKKQENVETINKQIFQAYRYRNVQHHTC
jgi:hypothetical protein